VEESADPQFLQNLVTKCHTLQQEICKLRLRVAELEEENKAMKMQKNKTEISDVATQAKDFESNVSSIAKKKSTANVGEYIDVCTYCRPLRCRTCEKRNTVLPSIISLLVKNSFIGINDLGILACVSPTLNRYICIDADDDIWSHLLFKFWPSTTMLSKEVLGGLPFRKWYERLVCSYHPGDFVGGQSNRSVLAFVEQRKELREQLLSMGDAEGEFPSLDSQNFDMDIDAMILIDVYCRGEPFLCTAVPLDEENLNSLLTNGRIKVNKLARTSGSIRMVLAYYGEFKLPGYGAKNDIHGKVHLVRLLDYKVVLVNELCNMSTDQEAHRTTTFGADDESYSNPNMRQEDIAESKGSIFMYGGHVGGFPSLLNCRLGDDDYIFSGARFDLDNIELSLPRSAYYYGYDYTVSKYREYQRSPDAENDDLDFAEFRELMWHNARNLPELVPFFEKAENEAIEYAADTRLFHVQCGPRCEFTLTVLLNYASIQHRTVADDDDAPHLRNDVTLRHILHELFERPECVLLG